jgi:hypothetical protein
MKTDRTHSRSRITGREISIGVATLFILLLQTATTTLVAEEKPTDPSSDPKFNIRSWRVPPGYFPTSSNPSPDTGNANPALQGAQSYLETNGITFPEGAFARYDPKASKVVIRNTQENLELAEFLFDSGLICIFPSPAVDIIALDCPTPVSSEAANPKWPTLEDIHKMPASEVRVLSQVSVLVKSGLRISARQTSFADGKEKPHPNPGTESENLQPGESGTKLEVEAVVGPDGLTVDLSYWYQLRRPVSSGTWSELNLSGAMVVQDNSSRIIHVSPLETKGRSLVLIAGVRMLDFDGTKTPSSWEQPTP